MKGWRADVAEDREAALLAISISRLPAANDYLVTLIERAPERLALEVIAALEPRHGDATLMDRVRAVASTRILQPSSKIR